MSNRDIELGRRQRPGEGGVGVSVYEHDIGRLALHHRFESSQHRAGLLPVRSAAHVEVMVW